MNGTNDPPAVMDDGGAVAATAAGSVLGGAAVAASGVLAGSTSGVTGGRLFLIAVLGGVVVPLVGVVPVAVVVGLPRVADRAGSLDGAIPQAGATVDLLPPVHDRRGSAARSRPSKTDGSTGGETGDPANVETSGSANRGATGSASTAPGRPRSRGRGSGDGLANEVRRTVEGAVERSPGTYPADVAATTGVPLSTVRYHVKVLVEEGRVEEATFGGKRRLYPTGIENPALAAALADDATASVLRTLARSGPATVSELAERLDRAPSTVSYHLSRLADDDLVVRERDGVSVVTRLHPVVGDALDGCREGSPDERATPGA